MPINGQRQPPQGARFLDPKVLGRIDSLDLLAAMDRLDPDDRALIAMRYVAGFDSTELAAAVGLSAPGTRARLARILGRLREELGHV